MITKIDFSNEPVFLVGGGPSLKLFNWRLLDDKQVIAINRSFQKLPHATIVYFSDERFFNWYKDSLLEHGGHLISVAKRIDHDRVHKFKRVGRSGLSLKMGSLCTGNDSGYAAINLAVLFKAKTIYLLGYDMCFSGKRSHWHDGYPTYNEEKRLVEKMLPHYQSLSEFTTILNVDIINLNLESQIQVFPKQNYKTILTQ